MILLRQKIELAVDIPQLTLETIQLSLRLLDLLLKLLFFYRMLFTHSVTLIL